MKAQVLRTLIKRQANMNGFLKEIQERQKIKLPITGLFLFRRSLLLHKNEFV